jgi:hypothetical protein
LPRSPLGLLLPLRLTLHLFSRPCFVPLPALLARQGMSALHACIHRTTGTSTNARGERQLFVLAGCPKRSNQVPSAPSPLDPGHCFSSAGSILLFSCCDPCPCVLGVLGVLSSLLTDIRHRQRGSMEPVDSNVYAVKHRTCDALPALSKRFRCLLVRIGREPRMEQQHQQDLANHRQPLISTICSLLTGFQPLTSPALACAGQAKAVQGGGGLEAREDAAPWLPRRYRLALTHIILDLP